MSSKIMLCILITLLQSLFGEIWVGENRDEALRDFKKRIPTYPKKSSKFSTALTSLAVTTAFAGRARPTDMTDSVAEIKQHTNKLTKECVELGKKKSISDFDHMSQCLAVKWYTFYHPMAGLAVNFFMLKHEQFDELYFSHLTSKAKAKQYVSFGYYIWALYYATHNTEQIASDLRRIHSNQQSEEIEESPHKERKINTITLWRGLSNVHMLPGDDLFEGREETTIINGPASTSFNERTALKYASDEGKASGIVLRYDIPLNAYEDERFGLFDLYHSEYSADDVKLQKEILLWNVPLKYVSVDQCMDGWEGSGRKYAGFKNCQALMQQRKREMAILKKKKTATLMSHHEEEHAMRIRLERLERSLEAKDSDIVDEELIRFDSDDASDEDEYKKELKEWKERHYKSDMASSDQSMQLLVDFNIILLAIIIFCLFCCCCLVIFGWIALFIGIFIKNNKKELQSMV